MAQTKVQLLRPDLGDVIDFDSSTLYMDGADNRVGIRNTNPQYELDVTGTVKATNFIGSGSTTIADWIVHDGDTNTKFGFPANDTYSVETAGGERLRITSAGVVSINDSTPETFATLQIKNHTTHNACQVLLHGADQAQIILRDETGGSNTKCTTIRNDVGQLIFGTHNDAYSAFSEKLRIASDGDVTITSADAGATGPTLKLFHNSASPADNDIVGVISMHGDDAAGNETEFASINTKVTDVSNGTEQAHLSFYTRGLGSRNEIFRLVNRSSASAPSYTTDDHNGIILDVYNTGNPYPRYMNFIAKSAGNTDSNIAFWTESVGGSPTEKLRITAGGKIGLNYAGTPPSEDVMICTSGQASPSGVSLSHLSGGNRYGFRITGISGTNQGLQLSNLYNSTYTNVFRITNTGQFLINRTAQHASSSERLSVNGMTSIQNDSTSAAGLYIFNEETTTSGDPVQPFIFCHDGGGIRAGLGVQRSTGKTILNGQFGISFRTGSSGVGGTEKVYIKTDGKVGINRSSPAELLDVYGTIQCSGAGLKIDTHPIVSYASFTDISGGSYAARLGSTGTSTIRSTQIYGGGSHIATFDGVNKRLGIGITAPLWDIHAQKSSGTTVIGCKNTGGNATVYLEASNTNTAKLELCEAGTGSYSLQVGNDNALMFFDDSDERMRIDSAGDIAINTNDGDFGQSNGASQFAKGDPKLGVHGSIGIMNTSSTTTDFSQLAFYRRTAATPQSNGSHRITSTHNLGKISWFGSSNDTSFPDEVVFITSIANGGDWWSGANRRASLQFHNNNVGEMARYSSNGAHAGWAIMNRDCNGVSGGAWTTHGSWKVLVDLSGYPTDQLYMCDAAMQHLSAYTATFWVYKCNNGHYDIIHEESSLCDFRLNGSQIEIKQSSGVDQTNTSGYQKIFAVAGMYKPLT